MYERPEHLFFQENFLKLFKSLFFKIMAHEYFCHEPYSFLIVLVAQVPDKRHILNLDEHLPWSFFVTTVKGYKLLTIFAKKLHCRCSAGF